jgi:Glycosyl transferase family 2
VGVNIPLVHVNLPHLDAMPQPLLSAIMIVKNEEEKLPRCLASLRGVADEIVVIDTGSTDRTVKIAREAQVVLGSFPWNGNEADARNASIQAATGRWLFMIDADEEVSASLAADLPAVLAKLDAQTDYNSLSVLFRNHHVGNETSLTRLIRVGRNRPGYAFSGTIHATCNYHLKTWPLQGVLEHDGYRWTDEQRQRKARHMIDHLTPLCAAEKPPLKPLCELMTYLLLAGEKEKFSQRWTQALAHSPAERTEGPQATYWYDNLSNILQFFATHDDWETGRAAAEEAVNARPGYVAASFYLLQAAVKAREWQRVEQLAFGLIQADLTLSESSYIIFPEKQLIPARAWHWLAQIELGKSIDNQLPDYLELPRLAPVILAAQEKLPFPLNSANPALKQILQVTASIQKNDGEPSTSLQLLAITDRLQTRQEKGSLSHLLVSLAKCALLQNSNQIKAMTDEIKSLTEIYQGQAWLLKGMQEVALQQKFTFACFSQRVAHRI